MSRGRFHDIRQFPTLESTNAYLLDEAKNGAPDGVVAQADHQSQGRGRLGRSWEAPSGASLLTSILMRPNLPPVDLYLCTAAVALAAVEACRNVAAIVPTVKWPNDLLVGSKKLAGILAEVLVDGGTDAAGQQSVAVVVGLGLNITWPGPEGAGGTSLADAGGHVVEPLALLDAVLMALEPRREALDTPAGRVQLADEWRANCATLGQQIRVELVTESFEGLAVGVGEGGQLVVQTTGGLRQVSTGDVVHLRALS